MACREVVRSIHHQVNRRNSLMQSSPRQGLTNRLNIDFRIDGTNATRQRIGLVLSNCSGSVANLALQIAEVHGIPVGQQQPAHSSCSQIQSDRTPKPAGTDNQHAGINNTHLPFHTYFWQQNMPAVAQQQIVIQHHEEGGYRERQRLLVLAPFLGRFIAVAMQVLFVDLNKCLLRLDVGFIGCNVATLYAFAKISQRTFDFA